MPTPRQRAYAERLLAGDQGSTVVDAMRADAHAFNSACTLVNGVSAVRMLVITSGDPRSLHPEYERSVAQLKHALATDVTIAGDCRGKLQEFVDSPLKAQCDIARLQRVAKYCVGSPSVRRLIEEAKLLPDNMSTFRASMRELSERKDDAEEKLLQKNEQAILITDAQIYLGRALYILKNASQHTPFCELGYALLLVSGRRFAEVYGSGCTFAEGPTPYSCIFDGALKKKRAPSESFAIPLLCRFDLFDEGLTALRTKQGPSLSSLGNDEVSRRWSSDLNRALRDRLFQIYGAPDRKAREKRLDCDPARKHPVPHDLRRFYIAAVYKAFDFESTTLTFQRLIMQFLGHTRLDVSKAYQTVKLRDFKYQIDPAFRLEVATTRPTAGTASPSCAPGTTP